MRRLPLVLKKLFYRVAGKVKLDCRVLGFPVLTVTQRDTWHTDIFFLCLPLFRVIHEPKKKALNLLLFTWLYKAFKYMFTKWELKRTDAELRLSFAGHTVYRKVTVVPYRFPTAMYRG